ncbi:ATP-binding protein [Paucilactobacillus hokkaidonensis]|uniref:ATP-binding protein n=1 Tax=Paucilactobacillus hokkaidonensis TaxID=1193095 RepID=UPI000A548BE5|nr:ATP-grasp domain-containing protein [Paucilactobacillus hokkaidonensis]
MTVIDQYKPDAILPNLGGLVGIRLMQELLETGITRERDIRLLGIPEATIRQINNPVLLNQTLKQMQAPTTTSQSVRDFEGALEITSSIGFPVIIKPVAPTGSSTRRTCHDNDELADAISVALGQSRVGQAMVQQSIAGYKEIELVVLRDRQGTTMQIAAIEDFDPIGIHAGDSIAFSPTQTLLDREVQKLRDVAFAITRKLRIVGVNHVQFALNSSTGQFYVIKNSPYFDRMTAFSARTTGYPLAIVCANLLAGKTLSEVKLPANFAAKTA